MQDNYFKSKDIKVFPSSFRNEYPSNDKKFVFDPESRLNTEANFIAPGFTPNHPSYIVDYDCDTTKEPNEISQIKFVLGGYYFELYNVSDYKGILQNKSIGITLREVTLGDSNLIDSKRTTLVLNSWLAKAKQDAKETVQATDYILDTEEGGSGIFYFVGLKSLGDLETADHIITLLTEDGKINQAALLANIDHGSGENTLTHGGGLKAGYLNQTVFGNYNANNPDSIFEVGNGTGAAEESRSNALEISSGATTINTDNTNINGTTTITGELIISNSAESSSTDTGALTVTGGVGIGKNLNVSGDTDLGSKLIIKTNPTKTETNVKINGTLDVTRKTTIYANVTVDSDKTILAQPVKITDDTDTALVVDGKTTVKKDLEVGNSTKVLTVKNSPSNGEQNVAITGTLKSTGKATFENGLEVSSGETTLGCTVKINGKATSDSTIAEDLDTILTTKDYVDGRYTTLNNKIDSLNSDEPIVESATGSYIQSVSQIKGEVKTKKCGFETTLDETTTTNAPTSKAVSDFVKSAEIKKLMYNAIYPVGSIYMTMKNLTDGRTVGLNSSKIDIKTGDMLYAIFDPANEKITTQVGGWWKRISQGRVLLGAGDVTNDKGEVIKTFSADTTGGYYDPQPYAHTHNYDKVKGSTGGCTLTLDQLPKKDFTLEMYMAIAAGDKERILRHVGGSNVTPKLDEAPDAGISNARLAGIQVYTGNSKYVETRGAWDFYYGASDGKTDSHYHSTSTESTVTTGQSETTNLGNMPPYLVCYIWQRVEE